MKANKDKEKKTSEGLKNVTQFLMNLIGNPVAKDPAKYKTNNINEEYKIRFVSQKYLFKNSGIHVNIYSFEVLGEKYLYLVA